MWCGQCGQDVPGIPSLEEGKFSCARCGDTLVTISYEPVGETPAASNDDRQKAATASTAALRPPFYDGWVIDEQLRHIHRVLGRTSASNEERGGTESQPVFRVDAGQGVPSPHMKRARRSSKKSRRDASAPGKHAPGDRFLAVLAWTALSLGTMVFTCGLSLVGWSMHTARQELWSIGMPIILAGQIALVLGLLLQVDRIWRDSRRAAKKMKTVDEQLHDLKTATSLLGTTHGPSSAFYAHWAGGAGADILLSDLKSQLDLLAVKLSKE